MEYHIERVRFRNGDIEIRYPIHKILFRGRSRYQDILVVESIFGKMLILDGVLQLTTYDEEIYHKALVYPTFKKGFKKILILGGGDGGAAYQLSRIDPDLEIDVVDIDPMVTEVVKKYIPEVYRDVFSLENINLINRDAFEYVREYNGKYDMVLGDLTDYRYEDQIGSDVNTLYSIDYLKDVKRILNSDGVVTYHVGGVILDGENVIKIYNIFREVFKYIRIYGVHIPSFLDIWCYISGSDNPIKIDGEPTIYDVSQILGL